MASYSRVAVPAISAVSSSEHVVSGQQHTAARVAAEKLQRSLNVQKEKIYIIESLVTKLVGTNNFQKRLHLKHLKIEFIVTENDRNRRIE